MVYHQACDDGCSVSTDKPRAASFSCLLFQTASGTILMSGCPAPFLAQEMANFWYSSFYTLFWTTYSWKRICLKKVLQAFWILLLAHSFLLKFCFPCFILLLICGIILALPLQLVFCNDFLWKICQRLFESLHIYLLPSLTILLTPSRNPTTLN